MDHSRDEKKRFQGKLDKAVAGLERHCRLVSPQVANAVLIKLPEWIDDGDACAYAQQRLLRDASHVSAVILFRSQVMSGASAEAVRSCLDYSIEREDRKLGGRDEPRPRTGASIGYMTQIIENPGAIVPFRVVAPNSLHFAYPYGNALVQRLQASVLVGGSERQISRSYMYWRAEHSYRTDIDEPPTQVRLQPFVLAGVSIKWRFYLRGVPVTPPFDVPSCPHDELVLL